MKHSRSYQGGRDIPVDEWLSGDAFEKLCDGIYHEERSIPCVKKEVSTLFISMYEIRKFMDKISEAKRRCVVISHNGDGRVFDKEKREIDISSRRRAKNVSVWYSVNVVSRGWGVISIPLGLENEKWFPEQKKRERLALFQKKGRTKARLLYLNHNIHNNIPQRGGTNDFFSKYDWATVRVGKNGMNYESYLEDLVSHDFVLCPEGNGPDTHRTWEALYLGTIPVLKKNILHQDWKNDLPIVWVDDWWDISEQFLFEKKREIEGREYDWKWLKMSYWKEEIQKSKKRGAFAQDFLNTGRQLTDAWERMTEKDYFWRRE